VTRMLRPLGTKLMFVLCVALLGDVSCNRESRGSAAPFPISNEVAGWAKTSDIRGFEASDLWQYIDGEAERYLKAGVQKVFTADYKFQNKVDATVDVYTMGNPDGAAKILESEPLGSATQVRLGDSARLYDQSLVFRKGSYLVRIVAYQASVETPQAIVALGRGIERRLTR